MNRTCAPYADVRDQIRHSDLLLYRRRRSLIARAGRGEWCHAAKALWWGSHLMVAETRGFRGARAILLSREVRRRPGQIDVFEANPDARPDYNRWSAAGYMIRLAGTDYGWISVIRTALTHLPVIRLCVQPDLDDTATDRRPPFCSQAVAIADRIYGGVDPVPNLADRLTEPCDLARSSFYKYRFTLL